MKRALTWLLDYWYIPLLIIGGVIAAIVFRKQKGVPVAKVVAERVAHELKVIEAGAEVRRVKAELGAEQAKQHIEDKYREQKAALDSAQAAEAKSLENDPVALAKYLARSGAKKA